MRRSYVYTFTVTVSVIVRPAICNASLVSWFTPLSSSVKHEMAGENTSATGENASKVSEQCAREVGLFS